VTAERIHLKDHRVNAAERRPFQLCRTTIGRAMCF
jgi:hypothetical protein